MSSPQSEYTPSLGQKSRTLLRGALERSGALPLARELRHVPDQRLHARRRRARLRGVRAEPLPAEVLFICQGNIYRSPYAAYAFAAALHPSLRDRIRVTSAGFVGPGRPSPSAALELAASRGIDMRDHRSSLITADRVFAAPLVVVMDTAQQRAICNRFGRSPASVIVLGDLDPEPIRTRTITDPWNRPPTVLQSSYERIERCVRSLAGALAGE